MSLVVDASVALAWCFEDEHDAVSDAVLARVVADGAVVPPIWASEVANGLLVAERRGRTTRADTERFLALLDALPFEGADHEASATQVVAAARAANLTAYDALYLVTAMQHGFALATMDDALGQAARAAGVPVIGR